MKVEKATMNCQLRLDIRDLVVLIMAAKAAGIVELSIGSALKLHLEIASGLFQKCGANRPETVEEGIEQLTRLGISAKQIMSPKSKVARELAEETLTESLAAMNKVVNSDMLTKALQEHSNITADSANVK